jgi:DNA-binding transcriptional MocR family regulator
LRVAFMLAPTVDDANGLQAAVRSSILMLPPLPVAVASAWIANGTAERAVRDISSEATVRGGIVRRLLGDADLAAPAGSLHAWLQLPASWTLAAFVAQAQQQGIRVAPADWYAITNPSAPATLPGAVRLALGAESERVDFERSLQTLASLLHQPTGLRTSNM